MSKLLWIFLLFSSSLCAEDSLDIDQQKERLSLKYTRGPYLLYDCVDKHWVCTDEREMQSCEKSRQESLLERDQYFSCAYIEKFKNSKICIEKQKWLTTFAVDIIFCLNPEIRNV